MIDPDLKEKTISGLIWKLLENFGTQLISFIIQIVLARILMPEDYGIVALMSVFVTIANVFIQTGFSSALIQKKDVSEIEYSSVFFVSIAASIFLYLILFITAPYIARFYLEPKLNLALKIQSIVILFSGISSVHSSIIIRELLFKKSFIYKLFAIVIQGITGISLAIAGYGLWALVASHLVNSMVNSASMWIIVRWRPKRVFSFPHIKSLFSFSSRILLVNLINNIFNNIKSLIIGKKYDSATLGYYNRGYQIPTLLMVNVDGAITTVMFPILSRCQNDIEKFLSVYRRSIKTSVFIVFPAMLGLVAIAEPLTILILTEKWLPSVPFMQITCLICMTWPFSIRFQAFNALGRSDVSLILNILGKGMAIIFIVLSLPYGVYALVMSALGSSIISLFIGVVVDSKIITYKIPQQILDVLPPLLLSIAMVIIVMMVGSMISHIVYKLIIQIAIGVMVYIIGAIVFKIETFDYLYKSIQGLFEKA